MNNPQRTVSFDHKAFTCTQNYAHVHKPNCTIYITRQIIIPYYKIELNPCQQ